jgi:signal transduction histidine kinase/ligand-binding sensor domain-containing protein/DNA-binding response OmpR family regulator
MLKHKVLVFLLLLLCNSKIVLLFAVSESIQIENFSYKDGLTATEVTCVYKDSKGFIWLCTDNGLFRYDGYSFKNINTIANGSLIYETYCVIEDKKNNFWIGTAGKGLYYYNTHTGLLKNLKLSEGNNSKINSIAFHRNKILLATNEGLIIINEYENIENSPVIKVKVLLPDPLHRHLQMNVINHIYVPEKSNIIWVGTNSPIYAFNIDTYQFKVIDSQNQNSIRFLSKYSDEKILASSWDGGIFTVNSKSFRVENDDFINELNKHIRDKRIKCALMDENNRCWIASYGDGLYICEKSTNGKIKIQNYQYNETQALKIKANYLNQIFIDNSGIAWISMAKDGLLKAYFEKDIFRNYTFQQSPDKSSNQEILTIRTSYDQNKFWVNFNQTGLALFDSRNSTYREFSNNINGLSLNKNRISHIYQDKKGNLWIVHYRMGIYVILAKDGKRLVNDNFTGTITPIDANNLLSIDPRANSYITTFYEDRKGRLWIGGWGETFVLDILNGFSESKTSNQLRENVIKTTIYSENKGTFKFPISPVNTITEIGNGVYWIGTRDAGIIEIKETSENKFEGRNLDLNEKLPSNNIKCFYLDKNNAVWIGTNSGLCYYYKNKLKVLGLKNGLASESINNIAEDKNNNIWISTSYGISRINSANFSIFNFFYKNNEKSNQYIPNAIAVTPNGNFWFSTSESLVTFNVDSLEIKQVVTPIYFTDVKINNCSVIPQGKYRGTRVIKYDLNESELVKVPYGANLYIEFATLDYISPGRILYKYKISNNNEWIMLSPGQRSLNLPNINPGEYTLSIMVANSSDKNHIKSIKIDYLPPFWLSKIAYGIYAIIVFLLLLGFRRLTIQKILQKSLVEKERYKLKKIEELDKMKSEFFSNISHEFRTPLSLIINPLEKLLNEKEISDKNKEKIKLIQKSSNRLLKLTNELMDFSKIEKELLHPDFRLCEIVSFTKEICMLFNNIADTTGIDYKINSSFSSFEIPIDTGMIEKTIFNLLSNAFKYTPQNGVIMVNLSKVNLSDKEYVILSVVNTGEGISKENLSKVFDRYYQVNNVQNRNIQGTGIGLALVKSFVELHNGKVEVKSEQKLETCFDVYLPVTQESFDNNRTDSETIETDKNSGSLQNLAFLKNFKPVFNYNVLVIEDEDDIRNYIIDELSTEYKLLSAKNGEEGINIANESIPDLIITDVMMPGISGMELCKILKNQISTSHIPIIILSAKSTINQQIEGLEMGADVYMVKPFNLDILKAQILRLINFKQTIYARYLKENKLIPQDSVSNKLDDDFMKKILSFIEENLTNTDLNVDQLANCVSLSKVQTYRKVKAISGLSIVEFIRMVRLKKASMLILEGKLNFSEIGFDTGFSTPSYFSKCFHDHYGKSPSEFADEFAKK